MLCQALKLTNSEGIEKIISMICFGCIATFVKKE